MRNLFFRFIGVLLLACTVGFVSIRGAFTGGVRFIAVEAPLTNGPPADSR
jgi:hypothetical protein